MTRFRVVVAAALLVVTLPRPVAPQGDVYGSVGGDSDPVSGGVVQFVPIGRTVLVASSDTVVMDQRRLRFIPSILPVQVGTTVEFTNSDPVMHNVFGPRGGNRAFNLGTYPRDQSRFLTFDIEGPHTILCHVHPEMVAWIVAVPTPYFTVTGEAGGFEMSGLPAGDYELRIWHRRMGTWAPGVPVSIPTDGSVKVLVPRPL